MYTYAKRILDIILSGLGLIALSPVFLILGILVKASSPGPIFFKQKRIGAAKKTFVMLKYRTMWVDAPPDTPTHLLKNPVSYITKIGHFLRKSSLDELPQLWNIFIGDMSIVGPRPALWNQDDLIAERDKYKANKIKPGLTGLAQVMGRDELPIAQKAAYDGEYCRNMGFLQDCRIVWKTALSVITGKGISEGGPK